MSIKLSKLKQNKIKAIVTVGDEEVVITNPTNEVKSQLISFIKESQEGNTDIDINKMFTLLLTTLTNIEVDVDEVEDIINSPSKPMVEIIGHLNDIIQDVVYEMLVEQQMSLSMLEKTIMGKDITNKVERINSMVKEIEGNTDKILS